jgi:hypothetical protein
MLMRSTLLVESMHEGQGRTREMEEWKQENSLIVFW